MFQQPSGGSWLRGHEHNSRQAHQVRTWAAFTLTQAADIDPKVAAQSIVDGFDDNGLDGLYCHQADRVVYVVQSKWIGNGNSRPQRGEMQKFLQGFRDLLDLRLDRFNSRIQVKKDDIRLALDDPQVRFVLIIAHQRRDGTDPQ